MSSTTSAVSSATCTSVGFSSLLDCGNGSAQYESGQTIGTLLAAIAVASAGAGAQLLVFYLLRLRLTRIYRPKSYLVAERERVPEPEPGLWQWLIPIWTTPNAVFIEKCGLDAYFFLRYLRMLLKLFLPLAVLILPILLPINKYSGHTARGLDELGWTNVDPANIHRLWAHLLLSVVVIFWFGYVVYKEFRSYIRIRQAYLTSPQHRIRASATTVLVSGIPAKWLTMEALSGLYDVFPGGIRNIWINRNYDALQTKVKLRDKYARSLESAETSLIQKCVKSHKKAEEKKAKQAAKAAGHNRSKSKEEKRHTRDDANAEADQIAQGAGISSGDPHQTPHNLHQVLDEIEQDEYRKDQTPERKIRRPLDLFGNGFNAIGNVGKQFVGEVTADVNLALKNVDQTVNKVNSGSGFDASDSLYRSPRVSAGSASDLEPVQDHARRHPTLRIISEDEHDATPSPTKPTGLRKPWDTDVFDRPAWGTPKSPFATDSNSRFNGRHRRDVSGPRDFPSESPPSNAAKEPNRARPDKALRDRPVSDMSDSQDTLRLSMPRSGRGIDNGSFATYGNPPSAGNKKSLDRTRLWPTDLGNEREEPQKHLGLWGRLKKYQKEPAIPFPSPQPHTVEEDEFPLRDLSDHQDPDQPAKPRIAKSKWLEGFQIWNKSGDQSVQTEYPRAFVECAEDEQGEPRWKRYMLAKDRDTMKVPNTSWIPRLPFQAKKVDKIYFLRQELARLNVEIEQDQQDVERYPFMNSAFIQFNHQVAAHMACQSLSHHIPQHMAPRLVEISPSDVLWGNMSIKWWERYLRTAIAFVVCVALIVLYAIPVTFTGFLSQIAYLAQHYSWLSWLATLPGVVISIIQGIAPPLILNGILQLVPTIFRLMVRQQGVPTGSDKELGVQQYYFYFLFIQVFLVVTLSSGLTTFIQDVSKNPTAIVTDLGRDLPKASNYFFSYLIVQALSNSASALLQDWQLFKWFIWAFLRDKTARQKWHRQIKLQNVQWGSFFPPFTSFAVIGLVYSIISPFILVFVLITFSLYWIVQRYNVLYVYQFKTDTGGVLFPQAINQLFTGLYVMELCLVGLFFLARDSAGKAGAVPQAVIMIVCLVGTVVYQVLLNSAFNPLFRYLPITLEDEAVIRDEEFARAQHVKLYGLSDVDEEDEGEEEIEDRLERHEDEELEQDRRAESTDQQRAMRPQSSRQSLGSRPGGRSSMQTKPSPSWKTEPWKRAVNATQQPVKGLLNLGMRRERRHSDDDNHPRKTQTDVEAQHTIGDHLFSGYSDELEDLTPEERDTLVRYSFQHSALRARRPVVWIPRDALGISDDEIARCKRMATVEGDETEDEEDGDGGEKKREKTTKTNIWMSNEGTALDANGKVLFRRSPPDFANVDLIAL